MAAVVPVLGAVAVLIVATVGVGEMEAVEVVVAAAAVVATAEGTRRKARTPFPAVMVVVAVLRRTRSCREETGEICLPQDRLFTLERFCCCCCCFIANSMEQPRDGYMLAPEVLRPVNISMPWAGSRAGVRVCPFASSVVGETLFQGLEWGVERPLVRFTSLRTSSGQTLSTRSGISGTDCLGSELGVNFSGSDKI